MRKRLKEKIEQKEEIMSRAHKREIEGLLSTSKNKTALKIKQTLLAHKHMMEMEKFRLDGSLSLSLSLSLSQIRLCLTVSFCFVFDCFFSIYEFEFFHHYFGRNNLDRQIAQTLEDVRLQFELRRAREMQQEVCSSLICLFKW